MKEGDKVLFRNNRCRATGKRRTRLRRLAAPINEGAAWTRKRFRTAFVIDLRNIMSLIECKNINRYFGSGENRVHMKDISSSMRRFLSPSSWASVRAKSTLMNRFVAGYRHSGSYRIDGIETAKMQPDELAALRRERFGFIFQR